MRTKYNKRRFRTVIMIFILLLCMSIGYSYLLTTLNIEGTSNIKANTWDVHWENVNVKSGSVTGDQVPIAAHVMSDTTQVEYSVILKNPGEYYEFTVDAKNAGSIDAMVSIANTKFYESNGITEISLPDYLEHEFIYNGNVAIEQNQLLAAGSSKTLKVKLKFKDNLDQEDLPTTDKTIVIRENIDYIQSDENAYDPPDTRFEQDSWQEICDNAYNNQIDYYNLGDTKEVDMGTFGKHTLRIANKNKHDKCSWASKSQTACGFVLEFADFIGIYHMNPTNTNAGGWAGTDMRTYINNDIYNALPTVLKNCIMDTYVVSGHGSEEEVNNTTTDKLYLLSTKETHNDDYDTASEDTWQLDYYREKGVTKTNYSGASKSTGIGMWTRTPNKNSNKLFVYINTEGSIDGTTYATNGQGVSPAFRLKNFSTL